MPDTDATLDPDGLSYRQPRAAEGRRREDIELRRLMRNRWARRLFPLVLAVGGYWLGNTKDEWMRIPSTTWTSQVNSAMVTVEKSRGELLEFNVRLQTLQQAIEQNSLADRTTRTEMLGEIKDLRGDLQKWFQQAGVPSAQASRPRGGGGAKQP